MNTKQVKPEVLSVNSLPEGTAILVADLNPDRELAVVSLDVLEHLVSLLQKADLETIKRRFIEQIAFTNSIEDYTERITKELDFHTSVNLVKTFFEEKLPTVGSRDEVIADARRQSSPYNADGTVKENVAVASNPSPTQEEIHVVLDEMEEAIRKDYPKFAH